MTSEYSDIYSRFLLRIEDYELAGLEKNLAEKVMNGYIHATLSKPYVRRVFSSVVADDDMEELEYELKFPVSDDEDLDFVEEMITLGMIEQWLNPKYHTVKNTAQLFANAENKWYSQAMHMTELKNMYETAKNDLRKFVRDRGYINNQYLSES